VNTSNIWIEANLKETQMTHIIEGQLVSFEVEAYPDMQLTGRVGSIAPASGAEFAILPPQNATGNWVKITQRIPVRLTIDTNQKLPHLRAGMSVTVSIDTQQKRSLKKLFSKWSS
jgi:membrane fusion protein (multidrug efflux system)